MPPRSRRARRLILWSAAAGAVLLAMRFLGVGDALFYYPDRRVYRGPEHYSPPAEEVFLAAPGGPGLHGWLLPAEGPPRGTVVHAHGNAGNLTGHAVLSDFLTREGFDVLLFDYRGYGRSEGRPSREGTVRDTIAALDWACGRDRGRVTLLGQSLGAARALSAAAERPGAAAAIVAEAAFTTHRAIGREALGANPLFLPLAWALVPLLLPAGWDPLDALPRIGAPILFVHGTADPVIPARMSRELHGAAPGPKDLYLVEGGGHLDLVDRPEYRARVAGFLRRALGEAPR